MFVSSATAVGNVQAGKAQYIALCIIDFIFTLCF